MWLEAMVCLLKNKKYTGSSMMKKKDKFCWMWLYQLWLDGVKDETKQ